jgi:hypothetical protein
MRTAPGKAGCTSAAAPPRRRAAGHASRLAPLSRAAAEQRSPRSPPLADVSHELAAAPARAPPSAAPPRRRAAGHASRLATLSRAAADHLLPVLHRRGSGGKCAAVRELSARTGQDSQPAGQHSSIQQATTFTRLEEHAPECLTAKAGFPAVMDSDSNEFWLLARHLGHDRHPKSRRHGAATRNMEGFGGSRL